MGAQGYCEGRRRTNKKIAQTFGGSGPAERQHCGIAGEDAVKSNSECSCCGSNCDIKLNQHEQRLNKRMMEAQGQEHSQNVWLSQLLDSDGTHLTSAWVSGKEEWDRRADSGAGVQGI